MGWNFRKSIKILPGVRLNFGKKGFTSATIGGKYAKTNVSKRGTYNTYSLPGTGVSYRTKLSGDQWSRPNTEYSSTPLNRYCQNCYKMNAPDSRFCGACGGVCPPNLQSSSPPVVKPNIKPLLAVIGGIFGLLMLCGLTGLIGNHSKQKETISSTPLNSSASNSYGIPIVAPAPQNTPKAAGKTNSAIKQAAGKTAFVISENANLRQSANQTSDVIEVVPTDSSVEVIKQRGVWFLVKTETAQGWMHGNTLRLERFNNKTQAAASSIPPIKSTEYQYRSAPPQKSASSPEPAISHSGASAKCGDGSLSYSAHRRGTCSHHGGVAVWY